MKKIVFLLLLMFSGAMMNVSANAQDLYIDSGASGSGTTFRSLEAAKEYIRTINSDMKEDIIVHIKSGEYSVPETITFTQRDSATNGHKIIYRGEGQTAPVISGGEKITGWKLSDPEKNIYSACAKGIDARAFFVNGECAVRARSEDWWLNDQMSFTRDKGGYVTTYTELADWKNKTEIELVYSNLWATPRVFVDSIVRDGDVAYITPNGLFATINSFQFATMIKTNPFYFENAYELLDQPGEFYIDKSTDTIYYIPRDGESMETADAVLPKLESVIEIQGSDADHKVDGIVFENISFQHSDWKFVSRTRGIYDRQANIPMRWFSDNFTTGEFTNPGIVNVQYAENCGFDRCEFSLSGGAGLKYSNAVQNSPITGNYVHDTYASGISVGEVNESSFFSAPNDKKYYTMGNHIMNNLITDVSRIYEGSCALFLGYINDTKIQHNEISYTPYSAISLGWGWATWASNSGYANDTQGTTIRDISIKYNYIHNIGIGSMVDGGGIYMLGATGGSLSQMNQCSENYIKDIGKLGMALYPDEGSTYWDFDTNVIDIDEDSIGGYGTKVRFVHIHQPTIYHVKVNNTYTTTQEAYVQGTECSIENTHYVPDRNWNDEALAVIRNAGLEAEYSRRLNGIVPRDAVSFIETNSEINLAPGENSKISYRVFNDYCQEFQDVAVSVTSDHPDIVRVEKDTVYGVGIGKATLCIAAEKDGFEVKKNITVYVGDEISEVLYENKDSEFVVGDRPNFKVSAKTTLGKTISSPVVTYQTDNPAVFTIDENGKAAITGSGEANLIVETEYMGKTKHFTKKIVSKSTNILDLSQYNTVKIGEIFNNLSAWNVEWGKEKRGDKSIAFQTNGGYALYSGRKYGNEILDFDFTIEADDGWPTILLRAKSFDVNPLSGNTAYFIGLKPDCVELQMFKDSQRYLYYGTLSGYDAIAGEAIQNTYYRFRERNNIKIGALTEENGVRIIVVINGMQVINYLDTTENAIQEKGYFGVICYDGKMVLDESSGKVSAPIQAAVSDLDQVIDRGYISEEELRAISDHKGVTKGEFTAFVLRALKTEADVSGMDAAFVSDSIYKNFVLNAMSKGIVDKNLMQNGQFDCDSDITREEAAAILVNALEYRGIIPEKQDSSVFADAGQIKAWAIPYVEKALGAKIYLGDNNAMFRPSDAVSLQEAAALLIRLAGLL